MHAGRPPSRETPRQGDPLPGRHPPAKETPLPGRHPPAKETSLQAHTQVEIEGDQVQAHSQGGNWGDQIQAHTQGGKSGGSDPGPHPRGKFRGIRTRPPPRTTTAAGGTHPTGMHSCYLAIFSLKTLKMKEIKLRRCSVMRNYIFLHFGTQMLISCGISCFKQKCGDQLFKSGPFVLLRSENDVNIDYLLWFFQIFLFPIFRILVWSTKDTWRKLLTF